MKPAMSKCEHDFTLILSGITSESAGVEDALFEAGCDDATLSFRMGRPVLTFSREANSLKDAILSAVSDVRSAGIGANVLRVDYCNLVTQADIARKIGRSRQLVHQYMTGARGPGGFPGPACELCDGAWVWFWCEVAYWLWENDMIKEDVLKDADEVEAINRVLDMQSQTKRNAKLTAEIVKSVGTPLLTRTCGRKNSSPPRRGLVLSRHWSRGMNSQSSFSCNPMGSAFLAMNSSTGRPSIN